ncbi:hypothetical protein [Mangrovimonas cancribranchiae]|uniref:DUF4168 domain-containing protein n=1 Tax=Mangrovimonas cancribranchiae TaxID=3080055 RepID=A0AAU6NY92_9FLAO
MKKYLSLLSFIAFLFVGMQSSVAQDNVKAEAVAKEKTYNLHQLVELSGQQQGEVFKVLVNAEQNLAELKKMNNSNAIKSDGIESINKTIDIEFKKILTEEQYKTYKKSLVKEKK